MTYIRRKVFSLLEDENGEARYFSTTEYEYGVEERIFSEESGEPKKDKKVAEKASLAATGLGSAAAAGTLIGKKIVDKKAIGLSKKALYELGWFTGKQIGLGLGMIKDLKRRRLKTAAADSAFMLADSLRTMNKLRKMDKIAEKLNKTSKKLGTSHKIAGGLAAAGATAYATTKAIKAAKKHKKEQED